MTDLGNAAHNLICSLIKDNKIYPTLYRITNWSKARSVEKPLFSPCLLGLS
jgi:hypothetical protein